MGGEQRLRRAQGQPQATVWMGFLCACLVLPAPQETSGPAATPGCGVCWALCRHEEDTACCPTQRFWGRKGSSGDQEKATCPGAAGASQGNALHLSHPVLWGCSGKGHTHLYCVGGSCQPPSSTERQKGKRGAPWGGCYLGELSEPAPPGHCCFSSA